MSEKVKALIVLALGSISMYLLLKAKEAQAMKKPENKLPLSYNPVAVIKEKTKVPKGLDIDLNNGTVKYKNDGKVNLDISWIVEKFPVLKQLNFEALPYQHESVYH